MNTLIFSIVSFSVTLLVSATMIGFSPLASSDEPGTINGAIYPAEAMATIEVTIYGEVVASTTADFETGQFIIDGLPPGTYELVITPENKGYRQKTLNDVSVRSGENNDLGMISLERVEEDQQIK